MSEILRAIADTNILVSAICYPNGICARLITMAIEGKWQLVTSPLILDELDEVLKRDKFRRFVEIGLSQRFVSNIAILADIINDPTESTVGVTRDPKEDFLIALTYNSPVEIIISGDKDLLELKLNEILVYSPTEFLSLLVSNS
ncbi:MAG: putative toxin-antitoxin system toxin component, PIN family [Acidimicrobiales bacterium]|nr:putative toxin-antitoxin system toxin component, PIN family [Acidimicrobiales bacterium]